MSIAVIKEAIVGQPVRRGAVSIFPIYNGGVRPDGVALADDQLVVTELDSASVPQLQVHNPTGHTMLIPAGRVLEGGRQTRTVNVSILVPAGATIVIPVSCVEAGRWNGGSVFRDAKRYTSRNVRMAKERGVKRNIDSTGYKNSDQGAVWNSIDTELNSRNIQSDSSLFLAAEESMEQNQEVMDSIRAFIAEGPADGQTGIAVAYGNKIAGMELFSNPEDLIASWEPLMRTAMFDSPAENTEQITVGIAEVEQFLADVAAQDATESKGTGLGIEYHVATERIVAHAITNDEGALLHAYAFAEI